MQLKKAAQSETVEATRRGKKDLRDDFSEEPRKPRGRNEHDQ